MKPIYWGAGVVAAVVGFMTAPETALTRLAVMGKFAQVLSEEAGPAPINQAGVIGLVNICLAFSGLAKQGPPRNDRTDRLCRVIVKVQDSTRVLNLGVLNVGFPTAAESPVILCLGAVGTVKCVAFGGVPDLLKRPGAA